MPRIVLSLERAARLPRVCIVCGDPDCDFKRVTLRPSATAAGRIALASREGYATVRLSLPLCNEHWNHFSLQNVLRYLCIAATIAVALLGMLLLAVTGAGWIIMVIIVAVLGVVAGWWVLSATLNRTRVHLSDFSGDEVTLSNVSPEFARSYQRGGGDEEDEPAPRRRTRRRYEEEDDYE